MSFAKSYIAWNKGTKGIMKPNKTSFKKGHPAPKTAFKKGLTPWNKGKKGFKGYWEGKTMSEEHRKNLSLAHLGHTPWNKGGHPKYLQRENHPQWKGGEIIIRNYVFIRKPNHLFTTKSGYIRKHRLVMEKHLGRYLLPTEVVHHVNKNTLDNYLENLILFKNSSEHQKHHHRS